MYIWHICAKNKLSHTLKSKSALKNTVLTNIKPCHSKGILGEQRWHSDESFRLPPLWPGFHSRTRRHVWVEFVVGSRLCSEGFSSGSPVFLPPQKSTLLNSNSIWKQWMKSHFMEMPLQIPIIYFIFNYFFCRGMTVFLIHCRIFCQ